MLLWFVSLFSCLQGLKLEINKLIRTAGICISVIIDIIMSIQHNRCDDYFYRNVPAGFGWNDCRQGSQKKRNRPGQEVENRAACPSLWMTVVTVSLVGAVRLAVNFKLNRADPTVAIWNQWRRNFSWNLHLSTLFLYLSFLSLTLSLSLSFSLSISLSRRHTHIYLTYWWDTNWYYHSG